MEGRIAAIHSWATRVINYSVNRLTLSSLHVVAEMVYGKCQFKASEASYYRPRNILPSS